MSSKIRLVSVYNIDSILNCLSTRKIKKNSNILPKYGGKMGASSEEHKIL